MKIYLESRYRKLVRGLPQTIFYCPECKGHRRRRRACERCEGYGKLTKDSVQELIARVLLPAYRARVGKFHGAGREDIDVRMLGRGRPFVFEVVAPRRLQVDLEELRQRLHQYEGERLEIDPLVPVARERVALWKESHFEKVYRAEVETGGPVPVDALGALVGHEISILQRTPTRVAHRRADLQRERCVSVLAAEPLGDRRLAVDVRCSHGTYVKEWISGDDGRTEPSLASALGVDCRCEALDVLDILLDESSSTSASWADASAPSRRPLSDVAGNG
ncbi:MAG: tRNA pseudouridine(54/55) synthase Pus10 [Planctomycetota bacterium]